MTGAAEAPPAVSWPLMAAAAVFFAALGLLVGFVGDFLVPVRVAGSIDGLAVVVAVVGNLVVGRLAALSTGRRSVALAAAAGWFVAAMAGGVTRGTGSLLIPGDIPGDSGAGAVALCYLGFGAVAAVLPVSWGAGPVRRRRR